MKLKDIGFTIIIVLLNVIAIVLTAMAVVFCLGVDVVRWIGKKFKLKGGNI